MGVVVGLRLRRETGRTVLYGELLDLYRRVWMAC